MCSPFRRRILRFDGARGAERFGRFVALSRVTAEALEALRSAIPLLFLPLTAQAQVVSLDPMIVTTDRGPVAASEVANSVFSFTADELKSSPDLTVDNALRSVPSFSLFRRNDSLTANPTTQGVSLRGLGPSGASRSLVLLDGLPLNDPSAVGLRGVKYREKAWPEWRSFPAEALRRGATMLWAG